MTLRGQSSGAISIIEFGLKVYSTRYTEHNTKITVECSQYKLYDKVPNLASDPKEHFNIGLHIIQNQRKVKANSHCYQYCLHILSSPVALSRCILLTVSLPLPPRVQ